MKSKSTQAQKEMLWCGNRILANSQTQALEVVKALNAGNGK